MYCLFEKTENKRKIGRGWPIFNKDGSLLFFRVLTFIVTNLSLIQWTIADQFYFGPVVINLKPCWNFELHSFVIMTRWNKNLNCLNFLRSLVQISKYWWNPIHFRSLFGHQDIRKLSSQTPPPRPVPFRQPSSSVTNSALDWIPWPDLVR